METKTSIKSNTISLPAIKIYFHNDTEYHGKGGYLSVSDGTSTPLSVNAYAPAMKEIGLPLTDCNGKSQIGTLLLN